MKKNQSERKIRKEFRNKKIKGFKINKNFKKLEIRIIFYGMTTGMT